MNVPVEKKHPQFLAGLQFQLLANFFRDDNLEFGRDLYGSHHRGR